MATTVKALEKVMGRMSVERRFEEWLRVMREAGGLGFESAGEEVRERIVELEQSTPKEDRKRFVGARNRVLALNGVLSWLLGRYRLQTEALLSRIAALLSLRLMMGAEDTRSRLADALEAIERGAVRSPATQMVEDVAAYCGAMFGYDESPLRQYWAETLSTGRGGEIGLEPVDLGELLDGSGEALERAARECARALLEYTAAPGRAHEQLCAMALGKGIILGGDLVAEADDVTLPPVDAQLARSAELGEVVRRLRPARDLEPRGELGTDVSELGGMLEHPRSWRATHGIIERYHSWLYPCRDLPRWVARETLEWRPWEEDGCADG